MKRALVTALAFITLMAGSICAPSAVAAGSITAKLIYILEKDGTAYEAISLSSTDGTINDSNCDDIDDYTADFSQSGSKSECMFYQYYDENEYLAALLRTPNGSKNNINFMFIPNSVAMRVKIAAGLEINVNDLNVTKTVLAIPVRAKVTTKTLSPVESKDNKYAYYTWNGSTTETGAASVTGTMELAASADGAPTINSGVSPQSTPSATAETTTGLTKRSDKASSSPPVSAVPTALSVKKSSKQTDNSLLLAIIVGGLVATIGIMATVLLSKKRKKPAKPQFSSPRGPNTPHPYPSSLQVESGRHTAVALIIQAAKYRYLDNKIVTTREGNNMRRKLTALMALLMLAGAGMIAPTATAQEYEGSYVTQLSSDGTITEFIAVMGVTEESCQSTKYKPVYDAKRNACLLGLSFKGERITKAFTLKLTSNGGTSYSFEFSTLSVSDYEALAHDMYRGDTIKITKITLSLPVGSVITNGKGNATKLDNTDTDAYRWTEYSPLMSVTGTTTLDASVAGYLAAGTPSPTPTPSTTTESSTPTPATSAMPTQSTSATAPAKDSGSNTGLYVGITIAAVVIAAIAIAAVIIIKKKQSATPSYNPYPAASRPGMRAPLTPGAPQPPYQPGQGQPPYGSDPNYPQA